MEKSETLPPAYAEDAGQAATAPAAAVKPTKKFPTTLTMHSSGVFSKSYTLSDPRGRALHGVSLHSGLSSQPSIVLHSRPDDRSTALATVERGVFERSIDVTLPSLPGGPRHGSLCRLQYSYGFPYATHSFAIETAGAGAPKEAFEWRHSSGAEVGKLGGGSGRGSGWKLVRVGSADEEVVAAWTWDSVLSKGSLRFGFFGSGEEGLLGQRWEIMALVSAVSIWDRARRSKKAGGAAGAAGAAGGGGGGGGGGC